MIHELRIKDPTKTPISWFPKVSSLASPRTFSFKPGLNILWGRNGSGKSTLLRLLGTLLHCRQGGVSVVTEESIGNLRGAGILDYPDSREGLELIHDGQGVRFFDAGHVVGLMGGGAAFDWDFGGEGMANVMARGSSGQLVSMRVNAALGGIIEGAIPPVVRKVNRTRLNDYWAKTYDIADHFLQGTGEAGPSTVILDEPERSLDLDKQMRLWRILRAYAPVRQIIVASHSVFALQIPEATYIDLTEGYREASEKALGCLPTWSSETPSMLPPKPQTPPAPQKPPRMKDRNRPLDRKGT